MQYWTKPLLSIAAGLLFLMSCSKPSELGLSLVELNPSEIFFTDSLSLQMTTVSTDPLPSTDRSRWLCGAYIDPIFGQTSVGIYTNFRLTSTNASFPNASFDSLVLSIAYDSLGHYGRDLNNPSLQNWEVYRLEEPILAGETYRTDITLAQGDLLGSVSFLPDFYTDIEVLGQNESPQLRIRLDDSLGMQLMNPDSSIYDNNTVFKEFFKGVYIKAQGEQNNSIIRFLPNSVDTRLTLYYRDSSGTASTFSFLTDSDAESVLSVDHDYTGTTVLNNNPTDTAVYVQGMNGPSAKITIPNLDSLGKDIVINKAELLIYIVGDEDRNYSIPDQVFGLERTADGDFDLIDDVVTSVSRNSFSPFLQFGGTLIQDGTTRYFRLNLSEYLQRFVRDEVDEKAIYIQPASLTDTERMLLGNENCNSLKAKLYLTYTKTN